MAEFPARHYYLGFNLVPGIGPLRIARLIERCGSVAAAWHASAEDLAAAGVDARGSEALLRLRPRLDLDAEMARLREAGVHALCIEDPAYPALLAQIPAPPPLIYLRGNLTATDDWAIAVVGTRSPTSYGREATRRLVGELVGSGVTIVSGLAIGIDTVAHSAALEAGGRTLAVLACGVDVPYPERNRPLAERILEQGALISDYPLGTRPLPTNFPPRNRIISGLARGTLVVEAGAGSGALITVGFALEQGRDVFAVPGSIFSRASVGTHNLLREGATPATCGNDVLEALDFGNIVAQQEARQDIPVDPTEAAVLAALSAEPCHIDVLGRATGLGAAATGAALVMLELKGLARQVAPMEYVSSRR